MTSVAPDQAVVSCSVSKTDKAFIRRTELIASVIYMEMMMNFLQKIITHLKTEMAAAKVRLANPKMGEGEKNELRLQISYTKSFKSKAEHIIMNLNSSITSYLEELEYTQPSI